MICPMVRQLLHALSGFLLVRIITAEVAGTEDGVPLFERLFSSAACPSSGAGVAA